MDCTLTFSSHGSLSTLAEGSSGSRLKLDAGSFRHSLRRRRMSPAAMNTGSLDNNNNKKIRLILKTDYPSFTVVYCILYSGRS